MKNFDYEKMGNRIRETRNRMKLTQEQLAEMIGSDRAIISRLENGYTNCSIEYFVNVANALGVSPESLLMDSLDFSLRNPEEAEIHRIISDCTPTESIFLIKSLYALRVILKDFTVK